jgi:hypothetical protein
MTDNKKEAESVWKKAAKEFCSASRKQLDKKEESPTTEWDYVKILKLAKDSKCSPFAFYNENGHWRVVLQCTLANGPEGQDIKNVQVYDPLTGYRHWKRLNGQLVVSDDLKKILLRDKKEYCPKIEKPNTVWTDQGTFEFLLRSKYQLKIPFNLGKIQNNTYDCGPLAVFVAKHAKLDFGT